MNNPPMKNLAQTAASVFAAVCSLGDAQAHDVVWNGNYFGDKPTNSMVLYYGLDWYGDPDYGEIGVLPEYGEPCTVVVNLNPPSSPVISTHFEYGINTARKVWIEVNVEGAGPQTVNATVSGEWHATGLDTSGMPNPGCDATNPHPFTVNVVVKKPLLWSISSESAGQAVRIDAGGDPWSLRWASSLNGPWVNVGVGSSFKLDTTMKYQFFSGIKKLGGQFNGIILGPSGNSQMGLNIGLPFGGPATTTDYYGSFAFPILPWGMNLMSIGKPITFTDPGTGSNRTENVTVNMVVPSTNDVLGAQLVVDMNAGAGPATNACTCTPWCAIGFGNFNGTQTPVYYSGGALQPLSGVAICDPPQVTVTPPNGVAYTITAGSSLHQNSGPNPASGTWTVTTMVCGQSKSCTVTVP